MRPTIGKGRRVMLLWISLDIWHGDPWSPGAPQQAAPFRYAEAFHPFGWCIPYLWM